MINFALYLLSFVASALIVLTAPRNDLRNYLLIYNSAGVVFSIVLFLYFSNIASVRRSIWVSLAGVVLFLAVAAIGGWYVACLVMYPGFLIATDYLVTQSYGIRVVQTYRIFMVLSAAPFLLLPDQFSINLLGRVIILAGLMLVLSIRAKESHLLAIRSPVRYLIGNYTFYNGTLATLAVVVQAPEALRWWYLSIQTGLVLILKVLDYSLRRAHSPEQATSRLVMVCASCVPLVPMVLYPNFLALCLFYLGLTGLIITGRYIST